MIPPPTEDDLKLDVLAAYTAPDVFAFPDDESMDEYIRGIIRRLSAAEAKVEELEATLDDEAASHQETLQMWRRSRDGRDRLQKELYLLIGKLEESKQEYEHHLLGCAVLDEQLKAIGLTDTSGDEEAGCWKNSRAEAAEAKYARLEAAVKEAIAYVNEWVRETGMSGPYMARVVLQKALAPTPDETQQ